MAKLHRRSAPTLRDVARESGFSHQTVSRVINQRQDVLPETRERVEAAVAKLGYSPNAIARSMAKGRSHTLACISPNLTDYTFASIIEGAESEARQAGYFLLSSSAQDEHVFQALVTQLVSTRRVDGLLVINPYADQRHRYLPKNFPTVFVGARAHAEKVSSVALDDENAARVATQHLLACGHRHIALVSGPLVEECAQDRRAGYEAALRAAGLEPDPAWLFEGDWSATSGYQIMNQLIENGPLPTAIFAENDRMAIGLLRAARDLGVKVPGQVAVIGFDDMPLSAYFDPPLTTMRQNMGAIGRAAVGLLVQAIDQPEADCQHLRLPAELIVRQTTCSPSTQA